MPRILIGTATGLHVLDDGGHELEIHHAGRAVNFVAQEGAALWAIVAGSELWRTAAGGWRHEAALPDLRARCLAPTNQGVLVGSSEARLFRITERGVAPSASVDGA